MRPVVSAVSTLMTVAVLAMPQAVWAAGKTTAKPKAAAKPHPIASAKAAASPVIDIVRADDHPIATMVTTKGTIKFALYTDKAPITATNFIELAKRHFFDGLTFHRVVPGFVIQGGDPLGTGEGGSGKSIPLEIGEGLSHDAAGVVAMARDDRPDSASSQFYITLAPVQRLDGRYAIFGRVTEGLDVIKQIVIGDKMTKVTIKD